MFSTTFGLRPCNGFGKAKERLDKLIGDSISEDRPWVFHDLRRTMRTGLSALPIPDNMRELMVGHGSGSMIGIVVGLLMCMSRARRQTGKTIALGSVACFGTMVAVLAVRGPAAPPAAATTIAQAPAEPKPENLSRSQILANFRIGALSWEKEAFGSIMVASFTRRGLQLVTARA